MLASFFHFESGLVGELAEVDLVRVICDSEHSDIRSCTKYSVKGTGNHHALYFRIRESDEPDRVCQLDVHTNVVTVELQLVLPERRRVGINL